MHQQTKSISPLGYLVGETRIQPQVYKLVVKGQFNQSAFEILCDRISVLRQRWPHEKVIFLIDFFQMTAVDVEKIKHYSEPLIENFSNTIFIPYGYDDVSKTLIRFIFKRVLISNIIYEKSEALALIRANKILSKEQVDALSFGVSAITGVRSKSISIRGKSFEWIQDKHWQYIDSKGSYVYEIELIDYNIFLSKPSGYIKYGHSLTANVMFDKAVQQTLGPDKSYYRIQDYTGVTSSSLSARRDFISYIIDNIDRIHLIVFFGLNTYMKAIVKFGILFHFKFSKVRVVETYEDALNEVLIDKYGEDIFGDAKHVDKAVVSLSSQNELQQLRKEIRELKENQKKHVDALFQRVSTITWEVEHKENNEYVLEDSAYADVYHALDLLNLDIQETNKERQEQVQMLQQQLEENTVEMKQLKKDIHHMHILKDEFIKQLNHELRTPLQSLSITLDMLKFEKNEIERNRYLDIIYRAGQVLSRKMSQIKDISDLNLRKQELASNLFNIDEVLQAQIESRYSLALSKKIEIVYDGDKALPKYLMGDLAKITKVVSHFLDNAIVHTNQGKITVRTKVLDDMESQIRLRVEVEDTGQGIAKEMQEHLFEDVYISGSVSSTYASNIGFGLFVCKQLIELMDGDIGFKSEEYIGSSFYFMITLNKGVFLKEMNLLKSKGKRWLVSKEKMANKTIMIANSDKLNKVVGQNLFDTLGVQTIFADTNQHILNSYKTNDFDILIIDVSNFSKDSLTLVRKIREDEKLSNKDHPIPIIGITANPEDSLKDTCIQAGMDRLLVKPFSISSVSRALNELL